MPRHPHHNALKKLATRDPAIAAALAKVGLPPPRERPPGFGSLVRIIVGQQVSAMAAASIWARMTAAIDPFTPDAVQAQGIDRLRALGLSRQKAAYAVGLAELMSTGQLDLELVHAMEDEAAIAELMKVKGFGRWSAEVYLLFSLNRADVFPAADLALQVAMQRLKNLRRRPDPKRLMRLVENWRPYRSAAAHFLWHYYHKAPFSAAER